MLDFETTGSRPIGLLPVVSKYTCIHHRILVTGIGWKTGRD